MNKPLLYLLIIILTACNQTSEKEKLAEKENEALQQIIDSAAVRLINQPLINSTSIGVVYREQEFTGHYGELEKNKSNSPSNKTIYEIGSLSKVLTGTLVANAVVEEKLSLEEEVTNYLEGDYPGLLYIGEPVRIKHLLTHSGGLPNVLPLSLNPLMTTEFLKEKSPAKIDSILNTYNKKSFLKDLQEVNIDTLPGSTYSYSTAGTELSAHILEQVYETNFETLLKNVLSDKTGMQKTLISLHEKEKENLAVGYHAEHPEIASPMGELPWGAGGGIKTTVPDMIKFLKFQLENNELAKETQKILVNYSEEVGVAYFWQVFSDDENWGTHYLHHGGVPRAQSYLFVLPEHQLGIFIITNQSGKDTAGKLKAAVEEIIEGVIENKESNLNSY